MNNSTLPTTSFSGVLAGWVALVVDDEPDNLDVARRLLKRAGVIVHTAENGREALDILQNLRPDFILTDISMPEMDGWTLISVIQKERRLAHIPMIALTAHAMLGDRERAFAAGFTNYITKPLDTSKFITNLISILVDVPGLGKSLTADAARKE